MVESLSLDVRRTSGENVSKPSKNTRICTRCEDRLKCPACSTYTLVLVESARVRKILQVSGACILLLLAAGVASGQTQDTYKGFHIGMILSEAFAVGGGNLEKAQAACANPPGRLSSQEHELLAKVCVKMERTLSGQPTEWEFPKEQLRIAFDRRHVIRVSDFDGVIHLQETQPQTTVSTPAPTIVAPTSTQQSPSSQAGRKTGMTGKVTEIGTTRTQDMSGREVSVQAVAITIDDPTNLNPYARSETYVVMAQAFASRTHVTFNVGDTVQFVRVGETRTNYGMLQILYTDEKGKTKQELHGIVTMR
jgi:hypothetical protein